MACMKEDVAAASSSSSSRCIFDWSDSVQKRGKEKGRSWLSNSPWLLLLAFLSGGLWWAVYREPAGISLKYGELKQILRDRSGVTFQKVRAEHAEVLGEMVTRDPVTDG